MATVHEDRTRRDIRYELNKWSVHPEDYEILWEFNPKYPALRLATGARLRYLRHNAWQEISCFHFSTRALNLRQCYLLLERLRKAEQHGVHYQGLTSSKSVVVGTESKEKENDRAVDDYDRLGAMPGDPTDMIKRLYKLKSQFCHPDSAHPDQEKFKSLDEAYKRIMKARGENP